MTELSDRTYERAQVILAEGGGPLTDSELINFAHAYALLYREHLEIVGWASRTVKSFAAARAQYEADMASIEADAEAISDARTRLKRSKR